ncbi:citrate synthase 1 [Robertmurraya siralis]|uniref:Citrate synthase n=2 Tax=Robertmurraya siralis TaxID=77777 RepID=A0A919WE09_9BACI|nr:citrate synthase 1 [Robertmurraya siralis]
MMYEKGLKGVFAAETGISYIDGQLGRLIYRGYDIQKLAANYHFEEVAYLLWYGHFPNKEQLFILKEELKKNRWLSDDLKSIISLLPPTMDLMSVIRTAVSAEGGYGEYQFPPTISQAVKLTALIPSIIAFRKRKLEGRAEVPPRNNLDHIENYLYMLTGDIPTAAHVHALEAYMILTLEHGMNASTFSARVTISSESDIVSAVTSAIGTMKGPLHGGAPSGVLELLDEISTVQDAAKVIRDKLIRGEKLMGFGHRVYKTRDPRAIALKEKLIKLGGQDKWLDLAMEVEESAITLLEEFKPGRALYTNVEFYAAAIMKAIQLEPILFTPTFTASRIVGWTAHILEQASDNVIYRPQSKYVGSFF